LRGVIVNGGALRETRRLRDVEAWLDDLARLEFPQPGGRTPSSAMRGGGTPPPTSHNLITFAPDGARGITAQVDGRQIASA
jgi:hypothetical protein